MKYVALLRGINVGTKTRIEMAKLRQMCENIGLEQVQTYINSGNVIFSSDIREATLLASKIEQAIIQEFGVEVPVLVLGYEVIHNINRHIPGHFQNNVTERTDVLFLWTDINTPKILEELPFDPAIENLLYVNGAIIWNIKRQNYYQSKIPKIITGQIYRQITIRNINTVRKLDQLMQ